MLHMKAKPSLYNNSYVLTLSVISATGGYLFGFDFAVISGALPFLKHAFNLNEYGEGFVTASLAAGCIAGCLLAAFISDKWGRRPGLMVAAFIFLISSLGMAFAPDLNWFIAGRFFAGAGVGMASLLSPMYIAEIAPAERRGRLVAIYQLAMVIGILVTSLVNFGLSDEGINAWRLMFGLGALPSLIFIIGIKFLPESPRWLIEKGKPGKAKIILTTIGGAEYAMGVKNDIERINKNMDRVPLAAIFQKAFLPSVLVGIGLAVFQQFCGINVVFNFSTVLFDSIGFSRSDQLMQTVLIGLVNLVFTLLAMWQVDKLGRKPIMLTGAFGLAVLYIISAVLLKNQSAAAVYPLLASIGLYAASLAPVTWILISEIFPGKIRSIATTVAVIALWFAYGLLLFSFPVMARHMGAYTPFYIYSAVCVAGFLFIWFKVKETKRKTLEEMEGMLGPH